MLDAIKEIERVIGMIDAGTPTDLMRQALCRRITELEMGLPRPEDLPGRVTNLPGIYRVAVSEYLAMPDGEKKTQQEDILRKMERELRNKGVDV